MTIEEGSDKLEKFVFALQERMKELDCIYKISSALHGSSTANEAVSLLIDQLPKGFRFTDQVSIRIEFNGSIWNSGDNWSNERAISSDIVVNGKKMGEVSISLINESLFKDEPFLKEERKLLLSATSVLSNTLERISIQDDMKDSLERLTFAIDASEEGVWDWNIKTGHVFFSRRWKEMLGFSDEEISSRVEEWKKRVHPEDLAEVESLLEKCLTGKTPNYQLEYRLIGKDGSSVWVLDSGKVVSRNSSGEPLR
ncbi:MAG TPA: PAS domain-containing protein, partial [Mesotoga sp.]|nr:PAS domain-containing protein [Mesotoga sp.]